MPLEIPDPSLVVLIGCAGSGKSTVAGAWPATEVLELDRLRALVSDCAGDQEATDDAVAVLDAVLHARLRRHRTCVIDATNLGDMGAPGTGPAERAALAAATGRQVRTRLVAAAHRHNLPAVAVVTTTPLEECLRRNATRPGERRVPEEIVRAQHAALLAARPDLASEGFDQVHNADGLDLLRLVMERSAAAGLDPLADVRAVFGNDLAAVFAFDPNSTTSEGHFAIAGRQLTVRWSDDGDVFDHHWQARLPNEVCDDCGSALWVRVTGARDLLDAYTGGQPDEPLCERCDIPDWCRA